QDSISEVVNGYCLAVRSALTDDGHPPLDAPGVRLYERLTKIDGSLKRLEKSAPPALRSPQRKDGASRGIFPHH
nr:hypothetical protein [Xenococcus sp. MO_188.B8]